MSNDGLSRRQKLARLFALVPVIGPLLTIASYADALTDIATYVGVLTDFASDPFGFVFRIISTYIVATLIGFGQYLIGSILAVFGAIAGYFGFGRLILVGSLQAITTPILAIGQQIVLAVANVVQAAGPLGPPIAAAISAGLLYATYRLIIAVAGEFPVGSTIVDFLGLR